MAFTFAALLASLSASPAPAAAGFQTLSSCTITTTTFDDGNVGTTNTWWINTSGCQTSQKSVEFKLTSGQLPPGTGLYGQDVTSAGIKGTPTTEGLFAFTIRARDYTGSTDTKPFSIRINPPRPLVITNLSDTLSPGVVGQFYCCGNLFASGGVPGYTWSLRSGQLPPGLALAASPGRITGTPTTAGTFSFLIRVTDTRATYTERTFSITIS